MRLNEASQRANVLAVDDNPSNLLALEAVLDREYNVIRASSGTQALSLLEVRDDIHVILMDIQMPEMDGFETAVRIKKLSDCQDIPIVFITAVYQEDPHIKRGYAAGGVDYFGKPFDPDILRMKVGIYASFRQRAHLLKERERQLRASEELLRMGRKLSSVLESSSVGVLITDREGRICQSTETVSRMLRPIDLTDRDTYAKILGGWEDGGRAIEDGHGALARALRHGASSDGELTEFRCFDGSTRKILTSTAPLRGLDAEIVGAAILLQDVTETKRIEESLEERITTLIGSDSGLEQRANP